MTTVRIFFSMSVLLLAVGCKPAEGDCEMYGTCAPTREERFQARLNNMASWGVAGAVTAGDDWYGASGYSSTNYYMYPNDRFRVASITKIFTATVILQLADEGTVPLDAPLSNWVPTFPNAGNISIAHLLSHTSGIPDYDNPGSEIMASSTAYWSPDAIVGYIGQFPLLFTPGTGAEYSNTNFILLGMVIESATGSTYAQQLRTRILDPLALQNTGLEGWDSISFVPGFDNAGNDIGGFMHPSIMWSAGGIVSDTRDLAIFLRAVYSGQLFSAEALTAMTTPRGTINNWGYGFGTTIYQDVYGPAYGHNGSHFGYSSHAAYRPAPIDGSVVLLFNTFGVSSDSYAGGMWDEVMY